MTTLVIVFVYLMVLCVLCCYVVQFINSFVGSVIVSQCSRIYATHLCEDECHSLVQGYILLTFSYFFILFHICSCFVLTFFLCSVQLLLR